MSKPNRRKGNAKTASSAHAADLLGQAVPFIGFDGGFTNVFESVESDFSNDLSSEVIIILKKLSKKDPQTREKALRELIETVSTKSTEELDGIFTYYVTVFDKLSLDGSPTVRLLSLKCLSIFICSLKKSAEKHLRKLIPFVLTCSCDISNVVSSQSEDLLSTCFPDGKAAKVVQIFSADAAAVCSEMISQKHPLFLAQKYDDEEDPLQRDSRLTTQSLQLLSKLAEKQGEAVITTVKQLLNDTVLVKKLLKSSPPVQSGLLNLAQKLPEPSALVDSPIAQFSLNNLDNSEPVIGSACFNVFLFLAQEKSFYTKYDAKKTVIPKLQNIVRKKMGHWRFCGPFLLPSMAAVYEQLDEVDAVAFGTAYLESFGDNMPFQSAAVSASAWSTSFAECLKYFLTKLTSSSAHKTQEAVIPIIIKIVDFIDQMSDDVHSSVVDLLVWICEKKALSEDLLRMMISSLQLNLLNKRPKADALISRILAPCQQEFALFHVDMLRGTDSPNSFVSVLEKASDEYLRRINKEIGVYSLIGKEDRVYEKKDLVPCARVALRLMESVPDEKLSIANKQLSQAVFTEAVTSSAVDWNLLGRAVSGGHDFNAFIAETLKEWALQPLSAERPFVSVLQKLESASRNDIIQEIVLSADHHAIDFVLKCAEEFELPSETRDLLAAWMLLNFFNPSVSKSDEIVKSLKKTGPSSSAVQQLIPHLLAGEESVIFSRFPPSDHVDLKENLMTLTSRAEQLLQLDKEFYSSLLVSEEFLTNSIRRLDELFVAREAASLCPYILEYPAMTKRDVSTFVKMLTEVAEPLLTFYEQLIGKSDSMELVEQTAAYALVVLASIQIATVAEVPEDLEELRQVASRLLSSNSFFLAAKGLLRSPAAPSSPLVHVALRLAVEEEEVQPTTSEDLNLSFCWALKLDCSRRKTGKAERWISKFHCEGTALEFLEHLREHMAANGEDWENVIFNARSSEAGLWQLNVFCLQAATRVMNNFPEGITPELLDFIMCGLVSSFDTCDDVANSSGGPATTLEFETFLGNALGLYSACYRMNEKLRKESEETPDFCNDWQNFYFPMLSTIILRLWSALPEDAVETLETRLLCKSVMHLSALPEDLGLPNTYTPEMDNLKYDPVLQTLIVRTVASLKSPSAAARRFAALHVLRLLAPLMFKQENEEWNTDEKKAQEVKVPFIIKELIMEESGFAMFAGMDSAMEPLKTSIASEDLVRRVLYCDGFRPLVERVLPSLISSCPQSLPESLKLTYFTDESISLENLRLVTILERRFPCCLLYRIVATVPAVVRTWFNSLPTAASVMVDKYISEMVTRHIVNNELDKVREANRDMKKDKALKIRVIPVCRQIVAEYVVEETTMSLTIDMPENYPLAVPKISLDKAIVASDKAKRWLLQLTAYLFHQNGAAVDGIHMWRERVDRDVEGAEACTICMMTVHSNTHQLPKVKCKQCKNKFHSNCLYKWFESSHQTSCPLCRTNFT